MTKVQRKERPDKYFLSTGSTQLNLVISGRGDGGIAGGRITSLYGWPSTGKTVIAKQVMGDAIRKGGVSFFFDVERTFDVDRAKNLFGCDTGEWCDLGFMHDQMDIEDAGTDAKKNRLDAIRKAIREITKNCLDNDTRFVLLHPISVEDLFDCYFAEIASMQRDGTLPDLVCVVVDSLTALTGEEEQENDLTQGSYNTQRPKRIGEGFRKSLRYLSNMTTLFIDQLRANIGGMGKKHAISGGNALPFYASTRVLLKPKGHVLENDNIVGIKVEVYTEKNKTFSPFKKANYVCLFDYGMDDLTANLEYLMEANKHTETLLEQKSSWFVWDGKSYQGLDKLIAYIEDNDLMDDVKNETVRVWTMLNTTRARKTEFGKKEENTTQSEKDISDVQEAMADDLKEDEG